MQDTTGVATIGEAHDLGWKLRAYCRHGKRDGMKSIRDCTWSLDVDLPTLVATRGRAFPLALVGSRMKCIRCASTRVSVVFMPPATPKPQAQRPVHWTERWSKSG